jgi:hypothetical protein
LLLNRESIRKKQGRVKEKNIAWKARAASCLPDTDNAKAKDSLVR